MASLTLIIVSVLMILFMVPPSSANQCSRFYDEIYSSEDITFGLQSYKSGINRITEHFSKTMRLTPEEKVKYFMSSDMRVVFFRLQSLSRVYEKIYKTEFFTQKRAFFKKYEDFLGKIDLFEGLLKKIKPMKEPRLTKHFEDRRQTAINNLFAALKEDGLLSQPKKKMAEILEELVGFPDWESPNGDLKLHVKGLKKELEKLAEDIKNRKFTDDDIEKGLHELRRRVRWPLIHIQTLTRLTAYNKKQKLPKNLEPFFNEMIEQNSKLLESGFLKMHESEIQDPILIPFIPHAMMTEIVSAIGTKKDSAEADIFIDQAMNTLGFSPKDRDRVEYKLNSSRPSGGKVDHKALSELYQQKIENSGLLEYYIEQLKKLN